MSKLSVIPYPSVVDFVGPDAYTLARTPSIACTADGLLDKAKLLQHGLQQRFGAQSSVICTSNDQHNADIKLVLTKHCMSLDQFRWPQESYELTSDDHGIVIRATTSTGIFYGMQTLLQALQPTAEGLAISHTKVADGPRFMWRGVLLDVGRHFFPVDFILKVLDVMALYKMNRFHWHLTEDQGWRLEVPALPRLAEVAAWRGTPPTTQQQQQQQQQQGSDQQQQQAAAAAEGSARAVPSAASYHGGFYSMSDVAQVVAYAAERCIEVVPEIELPGHCCAALAAYPHLSCTGDVPAVSTHWGIHEDVYCAGNEAVFSFLEGVLDQVMSQFPCQYIHIGGDEVPKVRWEECDKCQARMRQEGLLSEAELQSWFVRRISKYLASRGRKLIGWDEILEGGLAEGATVMSWRGNVGGIIAAKSGHDVIMTPTSHVYFDYRQAASGSEPGAWYACLPLNVVYHYDPVPHTWPDTPGAAAAGGGAAAAGGSPAEVSMSPSGSPSRDMEGEEEAAEQTAAAAAVQEQRSEGTTLQELHSRELTPAPAAAAAGGSPLAATQIPADAAAAAGPHYPGDTPGAWLASIAAAAAANAGGTSGGSGGVEACAGGGSGHSSSGRREASVLSDEEVLRVLGSQANLWTEYVPDQQTAEYMLLPRLAALAEAVWTPPVLKDWGCFSARLQGHLPLLDQLGYSYRPLSS